MIAPTPVGVLAALVVVAAHEAHDRRRIHVEPTRPAIAGDEFGIGYRFFAARRQIVAVADRSGVFLPQHPSDRIRLLGARLAQAAAGVRPGRPQFPLDGGRDEQVDMRLEEEEGGHAVDFAPGPHATSRAGADSEKIDDDAIFKSY